MNSRLIKKSILSLMLVSILVLSLVVGISAQENEGCSGFMAMGSAARGPTVAGQACDFSKHLVNLIMVVDEETGIKALCYVKEDGGIILRLNSYGVYAAGFGRSPGPGAFCTGCHFVDANEGYMMDVGFWKEDYPDLVPLFEDKKFGRDVPLKSATSAREAVEMWTEGMPEGTYMAHGPVVDTAFSYANTHLYKPLLQYMKDPLYSLNRQERVQELLALRYSNISALYAFSILRDRRYESEYSRMSEDRGNIARFGPVSRTSIGLVGELPSKYVDLLSILWVAPCYTPTVPFIPFYIGLPEIPPIFADGPDNEVYVFQELFNAVCWNMEYLDEVQKFWEAFEFQTVSKKAVMEKEVKKLADAGDREAAESVLYDFVNERCESAVAYAKEMTKLIVNGKSIKEIKEDVSSPVWQ